MSENNERNQNDTGGLNSTNNAGVDTGEAAGTVGGAAVGAAVGSVFGPLGTVAGAVAGGALGNQVGEGAGGVDNDTKNARGAGGNGVATNRTE